METKNKNSKKIFILVIILILGITGYLLLKYLNQDPVVKAKNLASDLKTTQKLPLQINQQVTLTDITSESSSLVYVYNVKGQSKEEFESSDYFKELADTVCQNPFQKPLLTKVTELIYRYELSETKIESKITSQNCEK